MTITPELRAKIDAITPAADAKLASESAAISTAEARAMALKAAIEKDYADRSNGEKAKVYAGHANALVPIYESMDPTSPFAGQLLAIIESLSTDATALAAMSDDAPVA